MNLDAFASKWLGGRTDYDKVYQYQCVDLILQYLAEVHGIRSGVWGNAIDYWTKPTATLLQSFEKVTGQIQKGDIVVLNPTSTNPYGHIMIAMSSTQAIEQNGATGDGDGLGGDEVRYRTIPVARVAGLLRRKGVSDMSEIITKDHVGPLRILHSEVGGWNLHETHAGKYDALFLASWQGKSIWELIWAQWNAPNAQAFRGKRDTQMSTYDQVVREREAARIESGNLRTTLTQRETEFKETLVQRDAEIVELKAKLAVQSDDTVNLNKFGEALRWVIARLGLSK